MGFTSNLAKTSEKCQLLVDFQAFLPQSGQFKELKLTSNLQQKHQVLHDLSEGC